MKIPSGYDVVLWSPAPTKPKYVLFVPPDATHTDLLAAYQAKEEKHLQESLRGLLERAEIPPRFREASFSLWPPKHPYIAACNNWIDQPDSLFLLFIGPEGTGKTTLATAAFRAYIERHRVPGLWFSWFGLMAELQSFFRTPDYTHHHGRILRSPLLLLDNLPGEPGSRWQFDTFLHIVDHRYSHLLPTIITANLSLATFREAWGGATLSRIIESGMVVLVDEQNYRKKRKAKT